MNEVSRYYDANTRAFLRRGQGGAEGLIHRAVWGGGARTRAEALHFVHELVLEEIRSLGRARPRILDLGCGVGGSLVYILGRCGGEGFGITNSEVQLRSASQQVGATWLLGDFCASGLPPEIDLAYAIESFVHARDPRAFFDNAARAIRPGGRLAMADDFLERPGEESEDLLRFREGWHAPSLLHPRAADELARASGLDPISERDLTPLLEIDRPRDHAIAVAVPLLRALRLGGLRVQSLSGGHALRKCLKRGLVRYRFRVYRRREVS